MTTLPDFQIPKIASESVDDDKGTFVVEPLDKGFGYTFGNSLRQVLLSSLGRAAIKRPDGGRRARVLDRPRRQEDVTDIVLNLKDVVVRMHADADEVEAPLVATGPGEIRPRTSTSRPGSRSSTPTRRLRRSRSGPSSRCT